MSRSRGPLPAVLTPLAVPLSWAYGAAAALRNARFDRRWGVRRLPIPTISIGNIVVGGSGKSPVVGWVASTLRAMGRSPMIALRGYGSADPMRADETLEHAARDPAVPVVAGADRWTTVMAALQRGVMADCVVLDDGFQHRRLHRDLDLVLIDARRPSLDDRLLPAGWLREPPSALRRADAVIVTHAPGVDDVIAAPIRRWHGRDPIAWVAHRWDGLDLHRHVDGGRALATESVTVHWLRGRRVVAMLGLANPSSVVTMAEEAGARIDLLSGADHARFDLGWLRRLAARVEAFQADAVLLTGKDWAKVGPLLDSPQVGFEWSNAVPVVVPRLCIASIAGGEALRSLLAEQTASTRQTGQPEHIGFSEQSVAETYRTREGQR